MPVDMGYECSCGATWASDQWLDIKSHIDENSGHAVTELYADPSAFGSPGKVFWIHTIVPEADKKRDVTTIDYRSGVLAHLHRKVTVVHNGEYRQIDYFIDSSEAEKVLTVTVWKDVELATPGYKRHPLSKLAIERWTKRDWYLTDNTVGASKVTYKKYSHDPIEQIKEGRRRRTNVIERLELDVFSMLVATTAVNPLLPTAGEIDTAAAIGNAFMRDYNTQISTYIRGGDLSWKVPPDEPNVTDDNRDWLSNNVVAFGWTGPTIRDEILAALVEVDE